MDRRSPLGKAKGLGSSKTGSHHWWAQRLTSVALVPLGIWFVVAATSLAGADYPAFKAWVGQHGNALLLVLFAAAMFHHAQQGVQVIVEDYVHTEAVKLGSILAAKLIAAVAAASCILAVFGLAYGS